MEERKPSEIIADFFNLLEVAKGKYESAYEAVGHEDSKVQTFLHDMEFAPNSKERNRVAAKFQGSRRERRKQKDQVALYENVYKFYTDKGNSYMIKGLRRLLNEQGKAEEYIFGDREFKKRVE